MHVRNLVHTDYARVARRRFPYQATPGSLTPAPPKFRGVEQRACYERRATHGALRTQALLRIMHEQSSTPNAHAHTHYESRAESLR